MPYMNDLLIEIQIGKDASLEKLFNVAIRRVFSQNYVQKIEKILKSKISLKEKKSNNSDVIAWTQGNKIFVNIDEFYKRNDTEKIKYLLHEFMHILNNSKSFLFLSKFKEINNLSKKLWEIVKENTKNPGMFLASRNIPENLLNEQEALSYLMNDKVNWKAITPEGAIAFKSVLRQSNIFNLESDFWRRRLQ